MLDPEWVRLLRIDDKVFLTKEQEVAVVEMPYYHEERYKSGKIAIKRWGWSKSEIWYIRPDGTGIDGSQIMTPYTRRRKTPPLQGWGYKSPNNYTKIMQVFNISPVIL